MTDTMEARGEAAQMVARWGIVDARAWADLWSRTDVRRANREFYAAIVKVLDEAR